MKPVLRPLERIIRPRLAWLFERHSERLLGAFLFLVAFALFLPIPLSGFIPAFALFIAGVGLAERDGVVTLLGLAIGPSSIAITLVAAITRTDKRRVGKECVSKCIPRCARNR